jgi:hypothetical protein
VCNGPSRKRSHNTSLGDGGERKLRPFFPIAAASTPIRWIGASSPGHATDAFSPGHVLIWINKTASLPAQILQSNSTDRRIEPLERGYPWGGFFFWAVFGR